MAQYEESQIEFAVLSIVRDPVLDLLSALAENINGLIAAHSRLDTIQPDWKSLTIAESHEQDERSLPLYLIGPDAGLGLTERHLLDARVPEQIASRLQNDSPIEVMMMRRELVSTQQGLRMAVQEEMQSRYWEEERARARTHDFGAKMQRFARKVTTRGIKGHDGDCRT